MNLMLERYLTESEISQSRTLKDFIEWFDQKLAITKEHREELKKQNILIVLRIYLKNMKPGKTIRAKTQMS